MIIRVITININIFTKMQEPIHWRTNCTIRSLKVQFIKTTKTIFYIISLFVHICYAITVAQ